jgi:hypothetical protein
MRPILAAGLAAGLLATLAPAASAHPDYHYLGGCVLAVADDTEPYGLLGGRSVWTGVAAVAVVATRDDGITPAPTAPISATCDLYVNGTPQGTIATAPQADGVTAGANPTTFTANRGDWVEVCTTVHVNGEYHQSCATATETQVVPQPVLDLLDAALGPLDPIICTTFYPLAPGIPGVVDVSPSGDVSILGAEMYDCPPYAGGTRPPMRYLDTEVLFLL